MGEYCIPPDTGRAFTAKLQQMFSAPFPFDLGQRELNALKIALFPHVRIRTYEEERERLRRLDDAQQAVALRFDRGHRIVTGPAGCGKTLVLAHRAALLHRYDPSVRSSLGLVLPEDLYFCF